MPESAIVSFLFPPFFQGVFFFSIHSSILRFYQMSFEASSVFLAQDHFDLLHDLYVRSSIGAGMGFDFRAVVWRRFIDCADGLIGQVVKLAGNIAVGEKFAAANGVLIRGCDAAMGCSD